MSMFHELMMRKKEENFLYPVIHGSLTESPEGVFSGFSSSNYLQVQNLKNVDINEIVLKINIPSSSLNQSRYMSALYGCISITTYSGASAFTYSVINTSGLGDLSIGTLQPDTNYWIKYINDGTNCGAWLSEDGISFLKKAEKSASLIVEVSAINYIGGSGSRYFGGSIDLNESYIKLGSTKYNLQAVVGYTIVGSPTITDGVVSGFSGNDYLNILSPKSVPTEIQSNNMKIKMKIKTPQQWLSSNMFIIGYNHSVSSDSATLYDGGLYITASGELTIHTAIIDNSQPYIKLELDTIYYIEIETKGVFKIGISQDNVNWTHTQKDIYRDKWYLRNRNIRIGRALTGYAQEFNGEIFINETSFIINNKLWFNGQQA